MESVVVRQTEVVEETGQIVVEIDHRQVASVRDRVGEETEHLPVVRVRDRIAGPVPIEGVTDAGAATLTGTDDAGTTMTDRPVGTVVPHAADHHNERSRPVRLRNLTCGKKFDSTSL
ncbi:MAG: hypothetical protein ACQER4_02465 [Bacteroidota bacterium]